MTESLERHLAQRRADALLQAAGHGDRSAFSTYFDRTAPVVLGSVRRVLGEGGQAELAVVNAYVRLWRTAPQFTAEVRSAHAQLTMAVRSELIRCHLGGGRARRSRNGNAAGVPR